MEKYEINIVARVKQMIDDGMNQILISAMPPGDDETKKQIYKIMTEFNRRGISTQTVLEVFAEALKEE